MLGDLCLALGEGPSCYCVVQNRTSSKRVEDCVVKVILRPGESIQLAVRRFRRFIERNGIKREMRRREYYEKPSETNRRARLRAERRARINRTLLGGK
jgi:small subunit ribosomal protein S21